MFTDGELKTLAALFRQIHRGLLSGKDLMAYLGMTSPQVAELLRRDFADCDTEAFVEHISNQALLDTERAVAWLDSLTDKHPPGHRYSVIMDAVERHSPELAIAAAELAHEYALSGDPRHALELTQATLDFLSSSQHDPSIMAIVLAEHANSLRLAGELQKATETIEEGLSVLQTDQPLPPDPHAVYEVYSIRASVFLDRRQLTTARESLAPALAIARLVEDKRLIARALVQLGIILHLAGDVAEAIRADQDALKILGTPEKPDRIYYLAAFNLIFHQAEAGDVEAARDDLMFFGEDFPMELREDVIALRGYLAMLAEEPEAQELLETARDLFLSKGRPIQASIVSLYLLDLHYKDGNHEALMDTAQAVVAAIGSNQPDHAQTAWAFLLDAARQNALSEHDIQRAHQQLRFVALNPSAAPQVSGNTEPEPPTTYVH